MFEPLETSYFLSRATVVPTPGKGMAMWREILFGTMLRNVGNVAEYLKLPAKRVIELGARVEIQRSEYPLLQRAGHDDLDFDTFILDLDLLKDWRIDRYYTAKGQFLDRTLQITQSKQ